MKNFKIVSMLGLISLSLLGGHVFADELRINDIKETTEKIESLTQERSDLLVVKSDLLKEKELLTKYNTFNLEEPKNLESNDLILETFSSLEKEPSLDDKLEQTNLSIATISTDLDTFRDYVSQLQLFESQLVASTQGIDYSKENMSLDELKQKESDLGERLEAISNSDIEISDTALLDQTKSVLSDKLDQVSNDIKNYKTLGEQVVANAKQYLGVPYVWGGKTAGGMDCSGLTALAYGSIGKSIGTWTVPQESSGTTLSVSQAQVGDLLFWGSHGSTHHVGIYIGGGQFIHAPTEGDVVKITNISDFAPDFAVKVI